MTKANSPIVLGHHRLQSAPLVLGAAGLQIGRSLSLSRLHLWKQALCFSQATERGGQRGHTVLEGTRAL